MAGIAAILTTDGRPLSPDALAPVLQAGIHLGTRPPQTRDLGPVQLGHCALPVLPASQTEGQPLSSRDGTLHVTADARLDNRPELLATLGLRASDEAPVDDARILLAAYRRWGTEMPSHLCGDFAFVLWDARARRLLGARDGLGVRPLCLAQAPGLLLLASEAQMIAAHPAVPARLDPVTAAGFLANRYADGRTFFEGIERLPAGHLLIASPRGAATRRYWDLAAAPDIRYRRTREYAAHLRAQLERAVADRLRTAAPAVGTYVSGGLDATTVTALAARLGPPRGLQVRPVNWAFPHLPSCHETPWAEALARRHGLRLHVLDATGYWQLDDVHRTPPALEEPGEMFDSLQVASLEWLREQGVTVLLTGVGGDHAVAGSYLANGARFWRGDPTVLLELWAWSRWAGEPFGRTLLRNLLRPYAPPRLTRLARRLRGRGVAWPWPEWLTREAVASLRLAVHFPDRPDAGSAPWRADALARAQHLWQLTAPNLTAFCRREHRLGARFGIDVRHPFVDARLAEFAVGVPPDLWVRKGFIKWLLREATRDLLPPSLRFRMEKPHFHAYYAVGLQGEHEMVRRLLSTKELAELPGYCYLGAEKAYFTYQKSPPENANPRIYNPVMFALWMQWQKRLARRAPGS